MPVPQLGVGSVQRPSAFAGSTSAIASSLSQWFTMMAIGSLTKAPPWWSMQRDDWLVKFVKQEGNDLLAGAVSTVTAKIVANSWYVEGPLLLATAARNMLLFQSDFGRGWGSLIQKWVQAYLCRDAGGMIELARANRTDYTGPALGFHHIDESKMIPTGDPEHPFEYLRASKDSQGVVKMHRSQVCHIVDMASGKDSDRGVGFCSTSRALATAHILMDVVRYKRERLSDLMPSGLLLINNLGKTQWEDMTENYDARQHNQGNKVWRDVMVALGVDPAYPIQADYLEFSQLPEGYSEKEATEVAIYTFALAFREDPREFWPVSSGPLGTATEAELQARSARIKGEGIICTAIERQLNRPEALPEQVKFHFDYQDDEQDKLAAEINNIKTQYIRRLWEPAKMLGAVSDNFDIEGNPQAEPEQMLEGERRQENPGAPDTEPGGVPTEQAEARGIITTEQAVAWLVRDRVIPWDIAGQPVDVERLYDTTSLRGSWGPTVRLYKDGRCLKAPSTRYLR